jgi:O-antigen ligase
MFLVIVEVLTNIEPNILLKQLKIVVSLYLFYNLYACQFNPLAIDPTFNTWRGMEIDKNHLAQSSLYCLLSSIVFFNFEKTNLAKIYNSVLGLIAVFLMYKARSSTVLFALAVIIFLGVIFKIDTISQKFGFGRTLLGMISLFILSFGFLFLLFSSEIFGLIPGYFGKDMTLSGRVPIWEYAWLEIEKRLLLGYGFATYWIMGNIRIDIFAATFEGLKVNQAHNGYLEILLQLGVVGSIFFLFPIIASIYRTLKLNSNLAILILVPILTLNYTESVLFKVGEGITTFYFMATYIALSVFYFNNKNDSHYEENN